MQRIRRAAATLVAAVVFCYGAAARAEGVMDQVPADALVVVKVNKLDKTSQKIGKWAEALGLAQLSPDAAHPLGALEKHLNVRQGLDRSGDMAFVFLAPGGGARAAVKANAGAEADENADANGGANGGGSSPDKSMFV